MSGDPDPAAASPHSRARVARFPADPARPPEIHVITLLPHPVAGFHEVVACVRAQTLPEWHWDVVAAPAAEAAAPPADLDSRIALHRVHGSPLVRTADALLRPPAPGAAAPFVVLLEPNGLLEPTALESLWWYLESHPHVPLVGSWWRRFGEREQLGTPAALDFDVIRDRVIGPTMAVRHGELLACGGLDPRWAPPHHRDALAARFAAAGRAGHVLRSVLAWERIDRAGIDAAAEAAAAAAVDAVLAAHPPAPPIRSRSSLTEPPVLAGVEAPPDARVPVRLPERLPGWRLGERSTRRLLVVLPYLFVGGSEQVALDVVTQLSRRGWDVTVVATDHAEHVREAEFARVAHCFVLDAMLRAVREDPGAPFHGLRFLRHVVASRGVDAVLVSNSLLGLAAMAAVREEAPRTATALMVHAADHPVLVAEWTAAADVVLCSSESLRAELVAAGIPPATLHAFTTNVDAAVWRPDAAARAAVRTELGVPSGVPVLLYASRLGAEKQPEVFAATMLELARRGRDVVALVTGDGAARRSLEQFVRAHRLERRIRLLGRVPGERLRELIAAADVCFLPSQREGISVVAFQCMAAGAVFVGADVGGQRELVTADCGVLLPRGEPAAEVIAYADTLDALLADPERLAAMRARSRERILAHFGLEAMGERVAAMLEAAIERSAARRAPLSSAAPAAAVAALSVHAIQLEAYARSLEGRLFAMEKAR